MAFICQCFNLQNLRCFNDTIVGNDVWLKPSIDGFLEQGKGMLPLVTLFTRTDGGAVGNDVGFHSPLVSIL